MALIQCPDCGSNVSSEAAACPNCARPIKAPPALQSRDESKPAPKKKSRSIGKKILLGLMACIGGIIWIGSRHVPASAPSEPASDPYSHPVGHTVDLPVFQTTPAKLYQMYEANEVATDNQLEGHTISMTGKVKEIRKDFTDSAILVFHTGAMFSDAQAELKDDQKPRASSLRAGQKVTVNCEKATRVLSSPMLQDCIITDPTS